jgi:hypothetical protein
LPGIGAFLQTNIAIVNGEGKTLASAKIIQVFRNPLIDKRNIQGISKFSISKLSSLEPISDKWNNRWLLEFQNENKKVSFEMNGNFKSTTPAVVFLAPRKVESKEIIEFNNREIGILPKIVSCEPGSYAIIGKISKINKKIKVQSDQVNNNIY